LNAGRRAFPRFTQSNQVMNPEEMDPEMVAHRYQSDGHEDFYVVVMEYIPLSSFFMNLESLEAKYSIAFANESLTPQSKSA
jgi:hypothetical protein